MKSYILPGIIFLVIALLFAGCMQQPVVLPATTPPTTAVPATLPATQTTTTDSRILLLSGFWSLDSMVKNGTISPIVPGTIITAKFTTDGNVNGASGCNNYFASYTINGSAMTVGPAGSTLMFCGSPAGVMEQESAYLGLLSGTRSFMVSVTTLTLSDASGQNKLVYQKYQPPGITGNWQLDSIGQGNKVSRIIAGTNVTALFATDGNLTGSAGCNNYFSRFRVESDGVTITQPIGSTKMYCADPGGVMTQESIYIGILQNVTKYSRVNNQLNLMDESGKNTLFFISIPG